ncbi:MAG: hypothetical protein DMF60_18010, partial [Acidobacteria bacterium]
AACRNTNHNIGGRGLVRLKIASRLFGIVLRSFNRAAQRTEPAGDYANDQICRYPERGRDLGGVENADSTMRSTA